MKQLTICLAAAGACLLMACGGTKSGLSDKAKKNLEGNKAVMDAFTTGDTSKIDQYVAADFVQYDHMGNATNRDSLKKGIVMMHSWDKTMKMSVIKEFADDDYAVTWVETSGTSDGTMGMPAGPYSWKAMEVTRFKDGKAVEHRTYMEVSETIKMMQGMAAPAPPADPLLKKDSL